MSMTIKDKENLKNELKHAYDLIKNYDWCRGCQFEREVRCPDMLQVDENGIHKCDAIEIASVSLAAIEKCIQIYF